MPEIDQDTKDFIISLYTSTPCLLEDLVYRTRLPLFEVGKIIDESGIPTWGTRRFTAEQIDFTELTDNIDSELKAYFLGLLYTIAEPIIDLRGIRIVYIKIPPEYGYILPRVLKTARRGTLSLPFNLNQIILEDDDFYEFVLRTRGADEIEFPKLSFKMRRHFFRAYFDVKGKFTITNMFENRAIYKVMRKLFFLRIETFGQQFTYEFIHQLNLILQPVNIYKRPLALPATIGQFRFLWHIRRELEPLLYRLYNDAQYYNSAKYKQAIEFVKSGHLYRTGQLTSPTFFRHSEKKAIEDMAKYKAKKDIEKEQKYEVTKNDRKKTRRFRTKL